MSIVKTSNIPELHTAQSNPVLPTIGTLLGVTEQGIALVDFAENTGQPVLAKSTLTAHDQNQFKGFPAQVLIVFEQSDIAKPVITGFVNQCLFALDLVGDEQRETASVTKLDNATIDGKKINFNAQEEIVFKCGKSSILLRRDGKVVIKGTNLISRSSSSNKIKGGSVSIN